MFRRIWTIGWLAFFCGFAVNSAFANPLQKHDEELARLFLATGDDKFARTISCSSLLVDFIARNPGADISHVNFSSRFLDALILAAADIEINDEVLGSSSAKWNEVSERAYFLLMGLFFRGQLGSDTFDRIPQAYEWSSEVRRLVLLTILGEEKKKSTRVRVISMSTRKEGEEVSADAVIVPVASEVAENSVKVLRAVHGSGQTILMEPDLLQLYVKAVEERDRAPLAMDILGLALESPLVRQSLEGLPTLKAALIRTLLDRAFSFKLADSSEAAAKLLQKFVEWGWKIPVRAEERIRAETIYDLPSSGIEKLEAFFGGYSAAWANTMVLTKAFFPNALPQMLATEAQKIAERIRFILEKG